MPPLTDSLELGDTMKRAGGFGTLALTVAMGMAGVALGQTPASPSQPSKSLPLSHVQQLQIEDYAKDVKLAAQQIELLKVQLAAALIGERQSEQNFAGYMVKLRTDLNAPASSWDFDAANLSFVPKGSLNKPPAKTAASTAGGKTAAAKKPGGNK